MTAYLPYSPPHAALPRRSLAGVSVSVVAALFASGCSAPKGAPKHPVSGTVTLDGKPLADGEVYFRMPSTGGLKVFPVKAGAFAGVAIAGRHRVEIYRFEQPRLTAAELERMDAMARVLATEKRNVMPADYNTRSALEAVVEQGGRNHYDFPLGRGR